jgi:ABC-2 type transport system permease protein
MTALLTAEWRRMVAEMVRYPVDTISAMATMFLIFAGLFYGARYITNSPIGSGRLATVVLGYGVWMLMMTATSDMGWSIQNEAQNGTLEQVMLAPWASVWIFLVRAVMAIAGFLVPSALVIAGLILLTHVQFAWSPLALLPVLMVVVTAWGLGLVVAAVALVLKRVGQILQIVQFLLLFVILAPITTLAGWFWHGVAMVVPFTAEVALLRQILNGGSHPLSWVWIEALVNMVLVFAAGGILFQGADRLARARGILGHY